MLQKTSLLSEVLDAHGGLDRWQARNGLSSTIVTGGALWGFKSVPLPDRPRRVTTEFKEQRARFEPFLAEHSRLDWTPDELVISFVKGDPVSQQQPRTAFAGQGFDTPWSIENLAYFNGYAMWTYHALPFVVGTPGYDVTELSEIVDQGRRLRGLSVKLPAGIHSHSSEQQLYFDEQGLLRRHDYSVDVWVDTPASHYLEDYVDVDGFKLASRRVVYPRDAEGNIDRQFEVVTIALSDFRFH